MFNFLSFGYCFCIIFCISNGKELCNKDGFDLLIIISEDRTNLNKIMDNSIDKICKNGSIL